MRITCSLSLLAAALLTLWVGDPLMEARARRPGETDASMPRTDYAPAPGEVSTGTPQGLNVDMSGTAGGPPGRGSPPSRAGVGAYGPSLDAEPGVKVPENPDPAPGGPATGR